MIAVMTMRGLCVANVLGRNMHPFLIAARYEFYEIYKTATGHATE